MFFLFFPCSDRSSIKVQNLKSKPAKAVYTLNRITEEKKKKRLQCSAAIWRAAILTENVSSLGWITSKGVLQHWGRAQRESCSLLLAWLPTSFAVGVFGQFQAVWRYDFPECKKVRFLFQSIWEFVFQEMLSNCSRLPSSHLKKELGASASPGS